MSCCCRGLLWSGSVALWSSVAVAQGGFVVTPSWDGIKACSGQPISSPSPAFSMSGVPAGTAELEFRMVDLDAPRFNHGGGKVRYTGQARIAPGAFQFHQPLSTAGPSLRMDGHRARRRRQVARLGAGDQELSVSRRLPRRSQWAVLAHSLSTSSAAATPSTAMPTDLNTVV
jgi:hypothetical protein